MTWFDYLVLAILGASVVISMVRGLVKEILSLAGWVIAFVVANAYGAQCAAWLPALIPGDIVRLIVAFIGLFIATRLLVGLLAMALEAALSAAGLGLVDRGLGGLFGLARGAVLVLAAAIVCSMTDIPQQPFWKQALLSPMVETSARTLRPFLPEALAEHVHF